MKYYSPFYLFVCFSLFPIGFIPSDIFFRYQLSLGMRVFLYIIIATKGIGRKYQKESSKFANLDSERSEEHQEGAIFFL